MVWGGCDSSPRAGGGRSMAEGIFLKHKEIMISYKVNLRRAKFTIFTVSSAATTRVTWWSGTIWEVEPWFNVAEVDGGLSNQAGEREPEPTNTQRQERRKQGKIRRKEDSLHLITYITLVECLYYLVELVVLVFTIIIIKAHWKCSAELPLTGKRTVQINCMFLTF